MGTAVALADVYYRLSVEETKDGESGSISNQKSIVRKFCEDRGIIIVKEFVDDGYSGSNFNRPGFQAMLSHVLTGKVNTVITKDLSRLGRDMMESSMYAEVFFPEHGIHYFTTNNDYDSENPNTMAPFLFAMNDSLLRDTSKKINQVISQKRQNGEYCACPPFGYLKDPDKKTTLIPDPQTAMIVQHIFELASKGNSAHAIAKILTDEACITPLRYRAFYRDNFCEAGAARATDVWCHTTVKRILKNQVYLGHTILGKTKKASVKSKKKLNVPEEDWVITKNTHPPLITQEQFDAAAYYLGMNKKSWQGNPQNRISIFSGLVFCANCGSAMCSAGTVYKGERNKYWYLACNNIPSRNLSKCNHGARIKYSDLLEVVKADLNKVLSLSDSDISEIASNAMKKSKNFRLYNSEEDQRTSINKRISDITKILHKLYQDNINGKLDDDTLTKMVTDLTTEDKRLRDNLQKLDEGKSERDEIAESYEQFFKLAKEYQNIEELTTEIVHTLIERIEIGEKILPPGYTVATHKIPYKQSIKIVYRFIGNIDNFDNNMWNQPEQEKKIAI